MDSKDIYSTYEFDSWALREDLISAEKFLLTNYLDTHEKTVEAGTAGGRILFSMLKMGFKDLHGYDFVPEFIEQAKKRDKDNAIKFSVEDATKLSYPNSHFTQIVYLQQILSAVGSYSKAEMAVNESYRILKKGGTGLFSFCDYEIRRKHTPYSLIIQYIKAFRLISRSKHSTQHLPWFKLSGKPNFSLFLDKEPYNYWFKPREAYQLLEKAGFKIDGIASQVQIDQNTMVSGIDEFEQTTHKGMLYFVCKK